MSEKLNESEIARLTWAERWWTLGRELGFTPRFRSTQWGTVEIIHDSLPFIVRQHIVGKHRVLRGNYIDPHGWPDGEVRFNYRSEAKLKKPREPDKKKAPPPPEKPMRLRLFEKQNGVCAYCTDQIPYHRWTVDHVVPKCRGGSYRQDNTVGACRECNNSKGNQSVEDFMKTMRRSK